MTRSLVVGILVGGRATRMGGAAKGLLAAPDTGEGLVPRLVRICRSSIPEAEIVLAGEAPRYAALGLEAIADDPAGQGPLGALHALLVRAEATNRDVIALACDLPYVTSELVGRLAAYAPDAAAVAPRTEGLWQPLFARYDAPACRSLATDLLSADRRALRGVLERLGDRAVELPLTREEAGLLDDWDAPTDVRA
ncbi:MAG TPA: NTP transferase domain-containing protein [Polyangiaceae bacterium]